MNKKKPWQSCLSEAITDLNTLFRLLKLDNKNFKQAQKASQNFALKIPRAWIKKIKKSDPTDPLLLQVLPIAEELKAVAGFELDPLHESQATVAPSLLHKYRSRVLFITSGACAINCRYCFRRNFPYSEHQQGQTQWKKAIDYIAEHPEINEVILSGGEPLIVSDPILTKLTRQLGQLSQLKTLRIHTRLPVFIPERLDKDFLDWFVTDRFKPVLVLHVNHPNEIDAKFARKMQKLRKKGVTLLSQSVLLKNVNDQASILKELSERLFFECGIQPYYLNLLDQVKGAAHFLVPQKKSLEIYHELLGLLPGYLVPKLAIEIPGRSSKIPII